MELHDLKVLVFEFSGWVLQSGAEYKKVITEIKGSTVRAEFSCGFMSSDGSAEILCGIQGNRQESSKTCW
jgi:hypothetical protein